METATQIVIYIVAILISSGFLTLVIVLVPAIRELKDLLADLQKTSTEVRGLVEEIQKISSDVEGKLTGFNSMLSSSQKIATNVSGALRLLNTAAFRNLEWLALIPAVLWGWKAVSKIKRRKNERQ